MFDGDLPGAARLLRRRKGPPARASFWSTPTIVIVYGVNGLFKTLQAFAGGLEQLLEQESCGFAK